MSPLTGLINPTHFGRPDLARIMDEHYESMQQFILAEKEGREDRRSRWREQRRKGRRLFLWGAAGRI